VSQPVISCILSGFLIDQAVDLEPYGVFELAFPISIAEDVLAQLLDSGIMISGGDLWSKDERGEFRPKHDNWFVNFTDCTAGEDVTKLVKIRAGEFFKRNKENSDNMVTFVVTVKR
jgi:hypothetical protein